MPCMRNVWKVHETCLPRCRLVAAPAPAPAPPGPTLLTARSAAQADIVGQGALAQVIVGHVDGRNVARKVTHDAKRNDELWKEFEILKLVGGHPNIVQVIEFEAKALRHAIVMEMLGPSLLNMLRFPGVAPFAIRDVARSLLSALDHIHGLFVAHCDVSARNLRSRQGWHMVLIDFLEHFRRQDFSKINHFKEDVFAAACVIKKVEDLVEPHKRNPRISDWIEKLREQDQDLRPHAAKAATELQEVLTSAEA